MGRGKIVRGWRIPPNREFTFATLLDLSRRIGARVRLKYSSINREFIAFVEDNDDARARRELSELLRAFPEQTIRL